MGNTIVNQDKSKLVYLEIARILAIFCVMFDHTGPRGSILYTYTGNPLTIYASLLSAIFCKIGVPLFLMISGALLIDKQESIQVLFKKRIARIGITLVLFSFIRYLYECFVVNTYSFSLIHFFKLLIQDDLFLPYWYLYTYIGILLILPFIRSVATKLKTDICLYFLAVCFFFTTIVPIISYYCGISIGLDLYIEMPIIYFVSGYIIEKIATEAREGHVTILAILLASSSFLYMFMLTINNEEYRGNNGQAFVLQLLYPLTIGIFTLIKAINWNKYQAISKIAVFCGGAVFGIYLIEDYLRNTLGFIYDYLAPIISPMAACLVWLIAVFTIGLIIIHILKKIPCLRKLL